MNSEKRLIVVLGMHRSGTSAITKGLEVLGGQRGAAKTKDACVYASILHRMLVE